MRSEDPKPQAWTALGGLLVVSRASRADVGLFDQLQGHRIVEKSTGRAYRATIGRRRQVVGQGLSCREAGDHGGRLEAAQEREALLGATDKGFCEGCPTH